MDSEIQTQSEYAEHTAKDAPLGPRRKQEGLIDTALAAQRQKMKLHAVSSRNG